MFIANLVIQVILFLLAVTGLAVSRNPIYLFAVVITTLGMGWAVLLIGLQP